MDFGDVQWLDVEGLKIRYLKGPDRTGVPLLLTSPWPESLFAFRKIWDRLTAKVSVVAVDLPGFSQRVAPMCSHRRAWARSFRRSCTH